MNETIEKAGHEDSERYARGILVGVRIALAALLAAFVCYASGWLAPEVPLERLPQLWSLPVADYLQRSGMASGWHWLRFSAAEDWLTASLALLLAVSTLCLVPLLAHYARRKDWPFLFITLAQIAVLVAAAAGVFT